MPATGGLPHGMVLYKFSYFITCFTVDAWPNRGTALDQRGARVGALPMKGG